MLTIPMVFSVQIVASAAMIAITVIKMVEGWRVKDHADKGRFGSYLKLCDFTLLFMTLQVELRLNKRIISETQTS